MSGNSFLSRILGRDEDEYETSIDSAEKIGTRRTWWREPEGVGPQSWDFTPEVAAQMLDELPSDLARESVAHIVRRTLAVAGIDVKDFDSYTRARMPKLSLEIELAQNRQKEFRERTEEVVRSLEEELRKTREAYEAILAKEKEEISRASEELKNIKRVRAFFGFPEMQGEH